MLCAVALCTYAICNIYKNSLLLIYSINNILSKVKYCYRNFSRKDDLKTHLISCQKIVTDDLQNFELKSSIILIPLGKSDKTDVKNNENDENGNDALTPDIMYQEPNLIDDNEDVTTIYIIK